MSAALFLVNPHASQQQHLKEVCRVALKGQGVVEGVGGIVLPALGWVRQDAVGLLDLHKCSKIGCSRSGAARQAERNVMNEEGHM